MASMVLERSKPCSNECKASHEHAVITVMMQFFDLSVTSLVPYMGAVCSRTNAGRSTEELILYGLQVDCASFLVHRVPSSDCAGRR